MLMSVSGPEVAAQPLSVGMRLRPWTGSPPSVMHQTQGEDMQWFCSQCMMRMLLDHMMQWHAQMAPAFESEHIAQSVDRKHVAEQDAWRT